MYFVPQKNSFRIHHVRPRFKNNIESVLAFLSMQISIIGKRKSSEFKKRLNKSIYRFPGNQNKTEKTINNWRTEISALFAFYIDDGKNTTPGSIAINLADNQNVAQMCNYFLYRFQYPGAHIKAEEIQKQIEHHIKFHPASYLLHVLREASIKNPEEAYISVAEATHCIFNDLRCTSINHEDYSTTWKRILVNRRSEVVYDTAGDVTRYAGDILDYMTIAGLLNKVRNSFYINELASNAVQGFLQIDNDSFFNGYDPYIQAGKATLSDIKELKQDWFKFASNIDDIPIKQDVIAYISTSNFKYEQAQSEMKNAIEESILNDTEYANTKEIGDTGEGLVFQHEVNTVINKNRNDLTHLITFIPTPLSVGYDFNSIEPDNELRRYIEVKTTVSSVPLRVYSFHMTKNEVRTAMTIPEHYFVYRLHIIKGEEPKLRIMKNPMKLIDEHKLMLDPNNDIANGITVTYDPEDFKEVKI